MQSRSGGWGAFDVDNTSRLCAKIAFCDFGAVTDPPSSDVTAHVLETLAHEGRAGEQPAQRGLDWLLRQQERDGSWFGRWGANYVYGTGAALPALAACGLAGHPSVRAGVRWLESVQNPGGGFGEDLRSYRDRSWSGRGALDGVADRLGAARSARGRRVRPAARPARAVAWLVETQLPNGGWDEPYYTGTGFPGDFYLNYHLYRDVFPVMALGRILGGCGMSAGLLVLVAAARSRSSRSGGLPARRVLRTGMGPGRARIAAARALGDERLRRGGGRCSAPGSRPRLRPGDVVCATGADRPGRRPGRGARAARCSRPRCAGAASASTSARCSRPGASSARTSGAASPAVRSPSTWSRPGSRPEPAGGRSPSCASSSTPPGAGSPTHGSRSPASGRSQRSAGWGRRSPSGRAAVGPRTVLLAGPRSFCAGVERAIDIVELALAQRGAPGLRPQADRPQRARRRRPRAARRRLRRGARRGPGRRDGRLLGARRLARRYGATPPREAST